MDFAYSDKVKDLQRRVSAFMEEHVYPAEARFHAEIAAIAQGVMARALQGNASSAEALQTGRAARPLAELAWGQVERLKLS